MERHPFIGSRRPTTWQTVEIELAFDWTLKMMNLLQNVENVLLATVEAGMVFNSAEDGDVRYFLNDIDPTKTIETHAPRHHSMRHIKIKYRELHEYQREILALREKCSNYKKTVSYPVSSGCQCYELLLTFGTQLEIRLSLVQKEVANQKQFTSVFTVSVCPQIKLLWLY
jgi:hypothetical protein